MTERNAQYCYDEIWAPCFFHPLIRYCHQLFREDNRKFSWLDDWCVYVVEMRLFDYDVSKMQGRKFMPLVQCGTHSNDRSISCIKVLRFLVVKAANMKITKFERHFRSTY
jgi:hypothetical protein